MYNRVDQMEFSDRWALSRTSGFDALSKFIAKEAFKPSDTAPNLPLKEGIFWSYFKGDFTRRDDYVPPSLVRRVVQIIGALLSFPFTVIYHLFLVTFNIRDRSLTWAGWSQQLAFCLTRDVIELLWSPFLLLSPLHQYASLCISHQQAQRFCLLNMYQQGQKNQVLSTFLWHLGNPQHVTLQHYLNKTSYEDFAKIYPRDKYSNPFINYFEKWSKDTEWIRSDPNNLERKLELVQTMLQYFYNEKHENLLINTLNQLEEMVGNDELRYEYACKFTHQLDDSQKRMEWARKLSKLDIDKNNPTLLAGKELMVQIFRGQTHYLDLFEKSKNKPVECEEQFGPIIKEIEEKDQNALIEFSQCLMERHEEKADPLSFKLSSEILIRYKIEKFTSVNQFSLLEYLFSEEGIELSFSIGEKIKKKENVDALKKSLHYFDGLLKLHQELHPYTLDMIPSDDDFGLCMEKKLIPRLIYLCIRFGTVKDSKDLTQEAKFNNLCRCFQLLEDLNLDRTIFEATIKRGTSYHYYAIKGLNEGAFTPLQSYLPKEEDFVKKLVAVNPKFLSYCHKDVFKNQKLLFDIVILDVTAIFYANIPLNTIKGVQEHLESFKTVLLIRKFRTSSVQTLSKPLMIKIFSHLITDSYAEANTLEGNLSKIANNKNLK